MDNPGKLAEYCLSFCALFLVDEFLFDSWSHGHRGAWILWQHEGGVFLAEASVAALAAFCTAIFLRRS